MVSIVHVVSASSVLRKFIIGHVNSIATALNIDRSIPHNLGALNFHLSIMVVALSISFLTIKYLMRLRNQSPPSQLIVFWLLGAVFKEKEKAPEIGALKKLPTN